MDHRRMLLVALTSACAGSSPAPLDAPPSIDVGVDAARCDPGCNGWTLAPSPGALGGHCDLTLGCTVPGDVCDIRTDVGTLGQGLCTRACAPGDRTAASDCPEGFLCEPFIDRTTLELAGRCVMSCGPTHPCADGAFCRSGACGPRVCNDAHPCLDGAVCDDAAGSCLQD
jgi:hypothetical protein